jgi:hypothetical protein
MSFHIEGDAIIYQQRLIGQLLPTIALGLRRKIEDEFVDFEVQGDVEERIKKAEEESWVAGLEEGRAEVDSDREEQIRDEAFDQGHAKGLTDAANASDAERVKILLDAMIAVNDKLLPIWGGRPGKIGDARRAAQSCCAELHRALNAYRAEHAPTAAPENIFA